VCESLRSRHQDKIGQLHEKPSPGPAPSMVSTALGIHRQRTSSKGWLQTLSKTAAAAQFLLECPKYGHSGWVKMLWPVSPDVSQRAIVLYHIWLPEAATLCQTVSTEPFHPLSNSDIQLSSNPSNLYVGHINDSRHELRCSHAANSHGENLPELCPWQDTLCSIRR
jgi:hypothetical protein